MTGVPTDVFGPLRLANSLRLLRRIELEVKLDTSRPNLYWPMKKQRASLQHFVKVIKQQTDDDSKKSLLKKLSVKICAEDPWTRRHLRIMGDDPRLYEDPVMFAAEELLPLRGIENVEITGVPAWYAECLQCCIQGREEDVNKHDYPQVKKRVNMLMQRVSAKKWYVTPEYKVCRDS
jgi:hypothetical protein